MKVFVDMDAVPSYSYHTNTANGVTDMITVNITRITHTEANELLQKGGLNWFLFSGDDFDKELFEEWAGVELDAAHVAEIESRLADLTGDEVLSVTVV